MEDTAVQNRDNRPSQAQKAVAETGMVKVYPRNTRITTHQASIEHTGVALAALGYAAHDITLR